MLIKSTFKDYYDVGMGQGLDTSLVYNRFPKVVEVEQYPFGSFNGSFDTYNYRGILGLAVESYCVGFCGKLYPILGVRHADYYGRNDKEARAQRRFCFTAEDVQNYVRANYKPDVYDDFMAREYRRKSKWPHHQRFMNFDHYFNGVPNRGLSDKQIAEQAAASEKRRLKWFEENNCPLFLSICPETKRYHQGPFQIVANACLKDVEFYRVFDSYAAFQELSMWLGNQAEPRKPIPKLDDVTMAEIKGFDKWSFRKPPKED